MLIKFADAKGIGSGGVDNQMETKYSESESLITHALHLDAIRLVPQAHPLALARTLPPLP